MRVSVFCGPYPVHCTVLESATFLVRLPCIVLGPGDELKRNPDHCSYYLALSYCTSTSPRHREATSNEAADYAWKVEPRWAIEGARQLTVRLQSFKSFRPLFKSTDKLRSISSVYAAAL